jgi:DNA-binding NarL/FixJ family response regulator
LRITERERDVLREIAEGRTNKEIALALGLRPKTVMHHCAAIYRKLGVSGRAEAAATALRHGLLDRSA